MTRYADVHPLRQPGFFRFLSGLTADLVVDQIWFIALAWAATRQAEPFVASLIIAIGTVPRMIFLLFAGVAVDRLGPLRIAQIAQLSRIAVMALAIPVAMSGLSIELLLLVAFLFGVADAARLPAAGALPRFLVDPARLGQAAGLTSTANRTAAVVGAPLGGLIIALGGGIALAAAVNVALMAASFLLFRSLRSHVREHDVKLDSKKAEAGLVAGFRYLGRNRDILTVLLIVSASNLCTTGPLNIGFVLRAQEQHWGASALGVIYGTFGLSAAAGSLFVVALKRMRRPAVAGLIWTAVGALAISALGLLTTLQMTLAAIVVAGFATGPSGALLLGLAAARSDPAYLGRITSMIYFTSLGLAPIAMAGFGFGAQKLDLTTMLAISGLAALIPALFGLFAPSVRAMTFPNRRTEGSSNDLPQQPTSRDPATKLL